MRSDPLRFSPPDIGEDEIAEVADALRSGWITTGPRTARFEEEFAGYVGAEAALAVSSGTAALHVGLLALGVGPGDAVIVPTMTFASAVHVVEHVGASPILVDSEPETLNLDPKRVEEVLGRQPVKCVMPVHLYGQPCDLGAVRSVAGDTPILDDAAHALPAGVGDEPIGRTATLTAFSFYATKNLTTGEGGMLTGPRDLIDAAREWTLHGMSRDAWRRNDPEGSWRYDVTRAGFKYNLNDVLAAIGLVQLRRLDAMHARRREIASRYTDGLRSLDELELPFERPGTTHSWHIFAIRLHLDRLSIDRDRFIADLRRHNISTSVHFIPVHALSYYRDKYGYTPDDFPVASREFERLVSLPLYSRMTDDDTADVIEAVTDVVMRHRR